MTYSTHIAAAKRMARSSARDRGTSYQTMLEDIARASGRSDWADFLRHPATPIEPAVKNNAETTTPAQDPEHVGVLDPIGAALTTASKPMVMTMIGLAITALVCFAPLREENLWAMILGSQIAIAVMIAAVAATISYGVMVMRDLHSARRKGLVRASALLVMIAGLQAGTSTASAWAMMSSPGWRSSIPAQEAAFIEEDHMNSEHIRFMGWKRDTPVASVTRSGGTVTMTIVALDDRVRIRSSRRDRPLRIGERMGGKAMQTAMVEHPVFRISGRVDCASSTFVPRTFELADRYATAAMVRHEYEASTSGRGFAMRREDSVRICTT